MVCWFMEVPRLATAPARVIIEAALVLFKFDDEGADPGVGTSELRVMKELLAVPE